MPSLPIHQSHVEPHVGQGATRLARQKFLCRLAQAGHLACAKSFGGAFEIAAFLDLDDDNAVTVRDRDTMAQERVSMDSLVSYLDGKLN